MIDNIHCFLLAESGNMLQNRWVIIVPLIILITLLLIRSGRRRTMGSSPKQYSREIDRASKQSMTVKREMERLLVELDELARQINGQIDTRFAKLEQSISDADKRISALRILINAAREAQQGDDVGSDCNLSSPTKSSPLAPTTRNLDVRIDDQGVTESKTSEGSVADTDRIASGGLDMQGDLNQQVYHLADEGRSAIEIARKLDRTVGEVELILNLRRRGG